MAVIPLGMELGALGTNFEPRHLTSLNLHFLICKKENNNTYLRTHHKILVCVNAYKSNNKNNFHKLVCNS